MLKKDEKQQALGHGIVHPSARPMKVYVEDGIMYLCDKELEPDKSLKNQAYCWTCDKVLFTRGG